MAFYEDVDLRYKSGVFEDRRGAGVCLARALERFRGSRALVMAVPAGGVPVGLEVAEALDLPFDLAMVRKIPIPGNPEAGLGALSLEGDFYLNEELLGALLLSGGEVKRISGPVREELLKRNKVFREGRPMPDLVGKTVILVDDGLASGYTMLAAAGMVKRHHPSKIVVAVPTAPFDTVDKVARHVDDVFCLNLRSDVYFAVAEAYRSWHDLADEEVVKMLRGHGMPG